MCPGPREAASARRWWLPWIALGVALAGCGRAVPPGDTAAMRDDGPPRIVTLAPALSRIIIDLGLGDRIVGVTRLDEIARPDALSWAAVDLASGKLARQNGKLRASDASVELRALLRDE